MPLTPPARVMSIRTRSGLSDSMALESFISRASAVPCDFHSRAKRVRALRADTVMGFVFDDKDAGFSHGTLVWIGVMVSKVGEKGRKIVVARPRP